ncbi:MAG: hypothetical protein NW223_23990 [Hyphomicrobiaceae bacterium]|nr:hypothetical protein [Hyphomicrobiaceae bacterium]
MAGMNVSITLKLVDQFTGNIKGVVAGLREIGKAASDIQKAFASAGAGSMANGFTRLQGQVRTLANDMRQLGNEVQRINGLSGGSRSGGLFGRQGLAELRQALAMQERMLANQGRLNQIARLGSQPSGWLGRNGFSPNASIIDRAQNRAVNAGEQAIGAGVFDLDKARTRLALQNLGQADQAKVGAEIGRLGKLYTQFSHAQLLDTFSEFALQFKTIDEGLKILGPVVEMQRFNLLMGDDRDKARRGTQSIVRAAGISSRLIDKDGNANVEGFSTVLEIYKLGKILGGSDFNADQFAQFFKYSKTLSQTLSDEAILRAALGFPDLRASTFGNQQYMLTQQLTGAATKEAQARQAAAGWITGGIDPNSPAGPKKFKYGGTIDSDLLFKDPVSWVEKHVVGWLENDFAREGKSFKDASGAEVASKLRPMFSNASAFSMVATIVSQLQEWQILKANALKTPVDAQTMTGHSANSLFATWQSTKAQLEGVIGAVAENFNVVLLPALQNVNAALGNLREGLDAKDGNSVLKGGLLAGGGVAGIMALRALLRSRGGSAIAGGALPLLLDGSLLDAGTGLAGGWLMSKLFGGGAAGVAGAAGGTAARGLLSRLLFTGLAGGGSILGALVIGSVLGFGAQGIGNIASGWDNNKGWLENVFGGFRKAYADNVRDLRGALGYPEASASANGEQHRKPISSGSMFPEGDQATISAGQAIPRAAEQAAGQITSSGNIVADALNDAANAIRSVAGQIGGVLGAIGPAAAGLTGNAMRSNLGDK